jgi:hypothetical protein
MDKTAVPYESRLLLRLRRKHEEIVAARNVHRIIVEVGSGEPPVVRGSAAGGDTRKLRGIPVLAPGIGSAIAGTQPASALIEKERRAIRSRD